jgi:hypothetical protein
MWRHEDANHSAREQSSFAIPRSFDATHLDQVSMSGGTVSASLERFNRDVATPSGSERATPNQSA